MIIERRLVLPLRFALAFLPLLVLLPLLSWIAASPSFSTPQKSGVSEFPVQLVDITRQAGIRFVHNNGAMGKKYLPETMGSGCAFLDYNNDGWQDILLINGMDWPGHRRGPSYSALYRNNKNNTF